MKVILRSALGEPESEHDIPPSEVEAFIALCRNHEIFDGTNDAAVRDITTQMCVDSGVFEVVVLEH